MNNIEEKDREIRDKIADIWNDFCVLEQTHPNDIGEFRTAIHELQKIMGLRKLRREFPDEWPTHKK